MFKIRVRVTRCRKNYFNPALLAQVAEEAAMAYARGVEELYFDEVVDWSSEHGEHEAYPIARREGRRTVINIYFRGSFAYIFALQDMGFMRKIAIIGGVNGAPKVGKFGTLATGRLLRTPRPVAAKHYTRKIAEACRTGNMEYGSYGDFVRRAFGAKLAAFKRMQTRQEYE